MVVWEMSRFWSTRVSRFLTGKLVECYFKGPSWFENFSLLDLLKWFGSYSDGWEWSVAKSQEPRAKNNLQFIDNEIMNDGIMAASHWLWLMTRWRVWVARTTIYIIFWIWSVYYFQILNLFILINIPRYLPCWYGSYCNCLFLFSVFLAHQVHVQGTRRSCYVISDRLTN